MILQKQYIVKTALQELRFDLQFDSFKHETTFPFKIDFSDTKDKISTTKMFKPSISK
jgi:hypothetical protein